MRPGVLPADQIAALLSGEASGCEGPFMALVTMVRAKASSLAGGLHAASMASARQEAIRSMGLPRPNEATDIIGKLAAIFVTDIHHVPCVIVFPSDSILRHAGARQRIFGGEEGRGEIIPA